MENVAVTVIVRVVAKKGMEDKVKFALNSLIAPTRVEEGCISYNFYQSIEDRALFISHEIWQDQESFTKHLTMSYIVALQEVGIDLLERPLEVAIVEPIG